MSPLEQGKRRWRCTCAYDGTNFHGWQLQPNGPSVQGVLGTALEKTLGEEVRTVGAGRTDAGVHARGQVFHFDAAWRHGEERFLMAMRTRLPSEVQVREIRPVSANFHALRSSFGKRYEYHAVEGWAFPQDNRFVHSLENRKVDLDAMREAAVHLVGKHDFSAFSASRRCEDNENPVKDLWLLDVLKRGPRVKITAEGGGFLYKMVRSLAGALFDVGIGKFQPDDIRKILLSRKRTALVVTAPARGLTLAKVFYRKPRR